MEERGKGEFSSLGDLCRRMVLHRLNKRLLEIMVKSGLLDCFVITRELLLSQIEIALKIAEQGRLAVEQGQTDLFGLEINPGCEIDSKIDDENLVPQNWTSLEILKAEKEVLGYFLSGHPLDENLSVVRSICSDVISNISSGKCRLVGLISSFRIIDTRRGKLALIELDDKTGTIEVAISEDEYNKYIDSIIVDDIVVVEGIINKEQAGRPPSVRANYIESTDSYLEKFSDELLINVDEDSLDSGFIEGLKTILAKNESGNTKITLIITSKKSKASFDFGIEWDAKIDMRGMIELNTFCASDNITLIFKCKQNF